MSQEKLAELIKILDGSVDLEGEEVSILDEKKLQQKIELLVKKAVLDDDEGNRMLSRYLVRRIAAAAGVHPNSIHDLYMARGRGEVPNTFTVPAINLRSLTFYAARIICTIAKKMNAGAFIFEIARSETGYTDQRPSEYAANILGAAVAAGYKGPVFIQGDHYQISASRYKEDPEPETQTVKDLTREAIQAGFFNIDVDTSTLVDLSVDDVVKQQVLNSQLTAFFTKFIREIEPEGITVSIGGEIGEVGEENSTEEELRAYLDSLKVDLGKVAPGAVGLSRFPCSLEPPTVVWSSLTAASRKLLWILISSSILEKWPEKATVWAAQSNTALPHSRKLPSANSRSTIPWKSTWRPISRTSFTTRCQRTCETRSMPTWMRITLMNAKKAKRMSSFITRPVNEPWGLSKKPSGTCLLTS